METDVQDRRAREREIEEVGAAITTCDRKFEKTENIGEKRQMKGLIK